MKLTVAIERVKEGPRRGLYEARVVQEGVRGRDLLVGRTPSNVDTAKRQAKLEVVIEMARKGLAPEVEFVGGEE